MRSDDPAAFEALLVFNVVCVVGVLVWMPVAALTGLRYAKSTAGGASAPTGVKALWLVSLAGVFTGPCLPFTAILGFVAGVIVLAKGEAVSKPTRAAGVAMTAHCAVLLVMSAVGIAVLAHGGLLG